MANGKYMVTIYGLVDDLGNIKYVGVTTKNPRYRFNNHIYEAKKTPNKNDKTKWISTNNYLINQIVLDTVPENEWEFWEKYWISKLKEFGFELTNGNNGGGGSLTKTKEFSEWLSNRNKGNKYRLGKKHTLETKAKMSKSKVGKPSPRKGAIISDDTKLKQSIAKIGKIGNATGFKHNEETKNKKRKIVLQFDSIGIIVNEFNSVSEAANYFGVTPSTISKVLNKENKKYKKFVFKTKIINNG